MRQHFLFIAILSLLIVGLGWLDQWVQRKPAFSEAGFRTIFTSAQDSFKAVESVGAPLPSPSGTKDLGLKRELLETLDRLVAYELYYRSVYGRFTQIVDRIGVSIPRSVSQAYQIQVIEATTDRLRVAAFSEGEKGRGDQISINQNFEVQSNFKLPSPRAEYLKLQAKKHLRQLRDALPGQSIEEQGVFKGYFRFEVRKDSEDRKVAFAVGIRPPVVGMQFEYGPMRMGGGETAQDDSVLLGAMDLAEFSDGSGGGIGERSGNELISPSEEEILAQKIFHGELGRYAKTVSELSKIVSFQFDTTQNDQKGFPNKKNQETTRQIGSTGDVLEIEPIVSE